MKKINSEITVAFAGGGTGGHIYPGLAVADEFRNLCLKNNLKIKIVWLGNSKGMDFSIVENNFDSNGHKSADVFYGIPSGKLRRYFSLKNFVDIFKVFGGIIASFFILLKEKPKFLFSKGGFVSVPPCIAAKILKIPVYTHECDFTPGLATRLNSSSAKNVLITYKETENYLAVSVREKCILTGNPVRPVFYSAKADKGLAFLGIKEKTKPILLVVGGSLGARQINELIKEDFNWLCENFIVVHQTGQKNVEEVESFSHENYKPYPFIYSEMPDVMACADVVVSRAGANSIWECAVLNKPMILIPLCGSGTRGDQEDNAAYFEEKGVAIVLARENACASNLKASLEKMLLKENRLNFEANCKKLTEGTRPAEKIAEILYNSLK